jgi:hypothetical protein
VTAAPLARIVRARVGCALASGLDGAERPVAQRWLDGCRRLDSMVVPFAGAAPTCPACAGDRLLGPFGWRCPVCERDL